jgi:hypothetical protein
MLLKKPLTEYNRYQAFAVHMAISLVIFSILLVCITQYWYPGILFDAGNGWKAIGIIAGIDLILGPLLTLIVFSPRKSSLKFDLAIILIVQFSALIFGTSTIYQNRPIALAYIGSNFHILYARAPFADAVIPLAKNNNYQLYYLIETGSKSTELLPERFKPYSTYQKIVLKDSIKDHDEDSLLVRLNKSNENSKVRLNITTGDILSIETILGTN